MKTTSTHARFAAIAAAAMLAIPSESPLALSHNVTDFRLDFSGAAADTFKLDAGWGDSLLMDAQRFKYKNDTTYKLNTPPGQNNGLSGAGTAVVALGPYDFKLAYVNWLAAHAANHSGPTVPANLVTRTIDLNNPDTVVIAPGSIIIGGQELPQVEAPVFVNFVGEAGNYAAYWGPNNQFGPVRRSSSREAVGPSPYAGVKIPAVPSGTPVDSVGGFGKVGACVQPGSGGLKYAAAYDVYVSNVAYGFKVRWENIGTNTSTATGVIGTGAVLPEDFAVAMDSLGNTVVLWRQLTVANDASKPANLWMTSYDSNHTVILAPTLIRANIFTQDSALVPHYYRAYAVVSQAKNNFLLAYTRVSGTTNLVYFSDYAADAPGPPGPESQPLTPAGDPGPQWYMYPDLVNTGERIAVSWLKRHTPSNTYRLKGSIFTKVNNRYSLANRVDLDMTGNMDLAYASSPIWYQYHYYKTGSLAMDAKGNIVVGFDNGSSAYLAVVRNRPVYYDSAAFYSKILRIENTAIPAFTFDPAKDSVLLQPITYVADEAPRARVRIALSPNNSFSGGTTYQSYSTPMLSTSGFYRYRFDFATNVIADTALTNLKSARVKSMTLTYNVKPRDPVVDSIKPGAFPTQAYSLTAAYPLLPRKDSLKLICSGFDPDDNGLEFRLSLGTTLLRSVTGTKVSPGNYVATISLLPPDTVLNPLPLTLTTVDADTWTSRPFTMLFDYSNIVPTQTVTIFRNKGRDSASVFRPSGAGLDTLHPATGDTIVVQSGDSLAVKAKYADGNDDNVTATWLRNSTQLGTRLIATKDSLTFRFTPDNQLPLVDTLVLKVGDPNITTAFRYHIRANRMPSIDSVFHAAYKGKDSLWKNGPFDKVKLAADTGLILPSGLMTVVQAGVSDTDEILGDSLSVKWRVWKPLNGCARGNLACYQQTDSGDGGALTRIFNTAEQYLTVRVTDVSGAFRERKLWLEYPVLDTSSSGTFAAAVKSLKGDIDFILGSEDHDTTVRAEITSQGSTALLINSVTTKRDDRKWLDVKLEWLTGTPPRPDSIRFSGSTTANALTNGKIISLAPGTKVTLNFRFESDSLRGDSSFTDTLLLQTNDFTNPVLKVPFHMVYNDLPVMTLGVPGSKAAGPANGYNAAGLPKFVPARSTLSLSFTETVRIPNPAAVIKVYSLLDSIARPNEYQYIKGGYTYVRNRVLKPAAGGMAFGKTAAAADSLADQLIFTPAYDRASDSLKVKPAPGFFIYRDVLHIRISNSIIDRAGNGLDLKLDKKVAAPGSLDMVFTAKVDTSVFAVVATEPEADFRSWNPESPIRIRFNRKLAQRPPAGTDSLTLLSLGALKAADSRAVRVTSVYRPGRAYDLQSLSLDDGDSSLVIRTRPRFSALDTVTVKLTGGLLDTSGLSLDGNGNRFPEWMYDQRDSVDAFTFSFSTTDADFYVYPNPYRFSDSRHREKGTITFKNLNSLRGYAKSETVTLRVHTMTGDLVFSSDQHASTDPSRKLTTSLEWDVKNDHGSSVGTGVYLYTLMSGGRKLLHKGKVAVVR